MHAFVCGSPSSSLRPYSTASADRRHFLDSDRRNSFARVRNPLLAEGQSQLQRNCQRPLATSCDPRVSMEGNQQSARPQEALQKAIDPVSERNDDMEEAYGEGYATFSNDEGFGGVYSSPFEGKPSGGINKVASAQDSRDESAVDTTVGGKGIKGAQEFDCTQGSPVAEKERSSRHGVGFTGDQRPS